MKYGYARVSSYKQSFGNSFEEQEMLLKEKGADIVLQETFTGTKIHRPVFDALISKLKPGDTLMVTKLDRFARSAPNACNLIRSLMGQNITVHILNMGIADNSSMGKLMITIIAGFAEFERDLIVERTQGGKAIAKTKDGFKEGRPKKFTEDQIQYGVSLLEKYSYKQVSKMTQISMSTLERAARKAKHEPKTDKT